MTAGSLTVCEHCSIGIDANTMSHWQEDPGHHGLCCDCLDLKHGMPLASINHERKTKGRPPIERPWPGRRRVLDE